MLIFVYFIYVICDMQSNVVAYNEGCVAQLEKKLFLEDAISDLPPVSLFCYAAICICYYACFYYAYAFFFLIRSRTMNIAMKCLIRQILKQNFSGRLD